MNQLLVLLTLLIVSSCNSSPEVTSGLSTGTTSGQAIDASAPYLWSSTFPRKVSLSSTFRTDEIADITTSSLAWDQSVSNLKNFFQYNSPVTSTYNVTAPDSVMGIYKAFTWPKDIDSNALAITQIFGRRYNVGDVDEYVKIEHADILINYRDHSFYTIGDSNAGDYDLKTVVLHEMGHFLGLQHIANYWNRPDSELVLSEKSYKASSVMYPSISGGEEKRIPQSKDVNELVDKYNIGGFGGITPTASKRYRPKNEDPGSNIRILIELKTSGECVHKEDGAVIQRHQVKLNN